MIAGLVGCAAEPLAIEADAEPTGVSIRATRAIDRVEVRDGAGPIVRRDVPGGALQVWIPAALSVGAPLRAIASAGGTSAAVDLRVGQPVSVAPPRAATAADVAALASWFPADAFGVPEAARTPDRIELPGIWAVWTWRALPEQAPWAWTRVEVTSRADEPRDVAVEMRVVDAVGRVPAAFVPRVRDRPQASVSTVLRLPARAPGSVTLPVFVDRNSVEPGVYFREITVSSLHGGAPLRVARSPMVVRRSGPVLAAGIALAGSGVLAGWTLLLVGLRRWLRGLSPADALVIGLLGSLGHLAGAVVQLAGAGVGAVLGPFAPFATGLVDDLLRACLLATMLALVPRPGAAALAAVVGTTVRAVLLGSVHPLDFLAIGSTVAWLEGAVWMGGANRAGWMDRPLAWWRFGAALVSANVALTATSLVFGAVGWRLYYSAGYVAAILILPGALYAALGCAVAVPFVASLRRVAP